MLCANVSSAECFFNMLNVIVKNLNKFYPFPTRLLQNPHVLLYLLAPSNVVPFGSFGLIWSLHFPCKRSFCFSHNIARVKKIPTSAPHSKNKQILC